MYSLFFILFFFQKVCKEDVMRLTSTLYSFMRTGVMFFIGALQQNIAKYLYEWLKD